MLSLHHSCARAQKELVRIGHQVEPSELDIRQFTPLPSRPSARSVEGYLPVIVPPLGAEAKKEIRRGRNPLHTFRRALRRLEIVAALQAIKARKAFALSQSARKWLPTH
jgi:hypothetical protein